MLKGINALPTIKESTKKGHMSKKRAGIRSTKISSNNSKEGKCHAQWKHKSKKKENFKTNDVFIVLEDLDNKIYTDQSGQLPRTSNKGMKGLLITYIYTMPMQSWCIQSKPHRRRIIASI